MRTRGNLIDEDEVSEKKCDDPDDDDGDGYDYDDYYDVYEDHYCHYCYCHYCCYCCDDYCCGGWLTENAALVQNN